MRVYHFVNQEFGLQDIHKRRVKVATLDELNDPFEFGLGAPNAEIRYALRSMKAEMSKRAGLICFSRTWRNPVQWSHYADGHKGVCLGFDIDNEYATPVRYRNSMMSYAEFLKNKQQKMREIICSKYVDWRHENEVRMFIDLNKDVIRENGFYFFPFGPQIVLKEVIVGHASNVTRKTLADALGNLLGVKSFKVRLSFREYKIVKQKKSELWK